MKKVNSILNFLNNYGFFGFVFVFFLSLSEVSQGQTCTLSAVNAGNDVAICIGLSTPLVATPSGGDVTKVTYKWTPVTGLSSSTVANPTATPSSTTTYLVTATEGTCIKTDQVVVTVNPFPILSNPLKTKSICTGSNTSITLLSNVAGTTFSWTAVGSSARVSGFANGSGTAINDNLSNSGATAEQVTYTITPSTSSGGCVGVVSTFVVTVNPLPVVNFSFNNNNTCSGTTIQFTSAVSGTGSLKYLWDFGDGTSTSTVQNPTHAFSSLGCATGTFQVKLTVTDGNGCSSFKILPITVKQKPDIDFVDNINPFLPFSNCLSASASNPSYSIEVGNRSTSPCIASYSIVWGDGSSASNITFPITHTYAELGGYNMVITALGSNGCSNSKTYVVKNVSNPSGGISSPGSTTNLCAPTALLEFEISKWGTNSPGTTYEVNFGDNSEVVTLTQEELVASSYYVASDPSASADYPVKHSFTTASCPSPQFTVTLIVTNACGSTPFTAGNISVISKSVANLGVSANVCVGQSVTFTNSTASGFGPNCNTYSDFTWDFGDGTPTVPNNQSIPQDVTHTFTTAGNYTATLTATNYCGTTTKTQPICVEAPLVPQFTLSNPIIGCTPLAVTATNTTDVSKSCAAPTYSWSVDYVAGNCGTVSSFTYTGGTSSTTINPSFLFTNPGTYSITLSVTNTCGTQKSTAQTVTVKQPPTVSIGAIPAICFTLPQSTINPSATVANCGTGILEYAWSFTGGTPSSSTQAIPGAVTYGSPGTYTVSLSVKNECGTTNASDVSFNINALPTVTGTMSACSGLNSQLTGSATAAASSPWESSKLNFATVDNNGLVTAVSSGITDITYTNSNGCKLTSPFVVNDLPTITGTTSVCIGGTSQLAGSATPALNKPWVSSDPLVATVSDLGLVTSIKAGTSTITYTILGGCSKDVLFTVNSLPSVTGDLSACKGSTSQLSGSGTPNGTLPWESKNPLFATVSNTGLVTAVSVGTCVLTYKNSDGCSSDVTFTVKPVPVVTGVLTACAGLTSQLSGSGTPSVSLPWGSSDDNVATVNTTGLVTAGNIGGTATITYTMNNGCQTPALFTVNDLPTITGNLSAGVGYTSQLTGSGTPSASSPWDSETKSVATISNTGLVTAISIGTSKVTYTNSLGCKKEITFTVSALPIISGTLSVCVGFTSQLSGTAPPADVSPWFPSDPSVASVDNTGLVTGVKAGSVIIRYTNGDGSQVNCTFIVNPLPTVTGNLSVGVGYTSQLVGSGTAAASSPWESSDPNIATVNNTGLVTAIAVGSCSITYTNNNGCQKNVTFDVSSLPVTSGPLVACVGSSSQLTGTGIPAASLPWVSSDPSVASVDSNGLVTALKEGTTDIIFTNNVGSQVTSKFTVNALPTVTGTFSACVGSPSQLAGSASPATILPWKSSDPLVATVNDLGLVTALVPGTTTITYTNINGCLCTSLFTVNVLPTITGDLTSCIGVSTQLTGSGTAKATLPWSSSDGSVGTVNNTGLVTALKAGSTNIIYTDAYGCQAISVFTVKPTPTVDQPSNLVVCNGQITNVISFTGTIAGTVYSWENSILSIGLKGADVGNIPSFTATNSDKDPLSSDIIVTPTANGCIGSSKNFSITVNPSPVVTFSLGNQTICSGQSIKPVTLLSTTASVTFDWYAVAPSSVTGVQTPGTNIIPVQTLENLTSADLVVAYKAKASIAGGATCNGSESTYSVTVRPKPLVTQKYAETICNGTAFSITPTDGNGNTIPVGTTYQWTVVLGDIIGKTTDSGASISDVLFNPVKTSAKAVYTVTPYGPSPESCPGTPFTIEVTVLPVAQINSIKNTQTVVSGQSSLPVTFTSDVVGANFEWELTSNSAPLFVKDPLQSGATSTIPSQLLNILPNGPFSCTLKYNVTPWLALPNNNKCLGIPFEYTIVINSQPTRYNLICPEPVCEGTISVIQLGDSDTGVNYQLLEGGKLVPGGSGGSSGTGSSLSWNISQSGTYTISGVNTINQQEVLMNGQCVVTINPLPISNYVIGSTGDCQGDNITLNGSQSGVSYELFNGNQSTSIIRSGPGPLDFGVQNSPGTYKIKATSANGCWTWIDGQVVLNPLPSQYALAPSGPLCVGDAFSIRNSESGVSYILWCYPSAGGLPQNLGTWHGVTSQPIEFGSQQIPGTYKVQAVNNTTLCDVFMADEKIMWEKPIAYNITPDGGPFCGLTSIGLNNSQKGYFYEVHDVISGKVVETSNQSFLVATGTGSALTLGSTETPGTYVIIGFDPNKICSTQMFGEVIVRENPTPYWLIPTGTHCIDPVAGLEVILEHSEVGINYNLTNGVLSVPLNGLPSYGPLSFGTITQEGTYKIIATNPANTCTREMFGSVVIQLNPRKFKINPTIASCPGEADIWLSGSELGVNYTLYSPDGLLVNKLGTGNSLNWGKKTEPGTYYIKAQSTTSPCNAIMDGIVTINSNPGVYAVMSQGISCEPVKVGMVNSEAKTVYEIVDNNAQSLSPVISFTTINAGSFWFGTNLPAGSYQVKATNALGCSKIMDGTVIVNPLPTVDAGPVEISICNAPPYQIELKGIATDYSSLKWSSPTSLDGSNFGDTNSATTTYNFTALDISRKYVDLTLSVVGKDGCINTTVKDQIKVNILASFVDAGSDQVVCVGEDVALVGSITGGITTGEWTGGNGKFIKDVTSLINTYQPDPSEAGTKVKLTLTTTKSIYCPGISDDIYVTILKPLTAGIITSDKTIVCYNESQLLTSSNLTGGSGTFIYQWQYFNGSDWVSVTSGISNTKTYDTGALTATTRYRLAITDTYCKPNITVYTDPLTITVNGLLVTGKAGNDQSICYGETPTTLTATNPTGGCGTFSYQWQSKVGTTDWASITGATSLTYSPQVLYESTSYQLVQTDETCSPKKTVTTNGVTITVYGELKAGTASADQTVCYGESTVLTATAPTGGSGASNFSYQWQTFNGTAWDDLIAPGSKTLSFNTGALVVTTKYRLLQTDTYCNPDKILITNSITITVFDNLIPGKVSSDKTTLCYNESQLLTTSNPTGGSGTFIYQWQYFNGINWISVTSGVSNTKTYDTGALTTTTRYRLAITDTYCKPNIIVYSEPLTITVNGLLTAGIAGNDQTICYGETPAALTATSPTGGSGTFNYRWQSKVGTSDWASITGATSLTYSPLALYVNTSYQLVQTDESCSPKQTVTTNGVTITVYSELMAGTTSADQTVCYGESTVLTATAPTGGSGASNFSYQWQTFNGIGWDDLKAPGSKTLSFNTGALVLTTKYRLLQTDTYCNPDKILITNSITVTVFDNLVPGKVTSDKTTVCYNESQLLTASNPVGGSGTFNYQWQYFNGIDWLSVTSGVSNTRTYDTGALTRTTSYRLAITDTYCKPNITVYSDPLTMTVNGLLVAGKAGNDQSICYGETPAALTATSPTGGCGTFSYQWQSKVGTSDWASITGATSLTYSPPALYVNTSYQLVQTDESCSPKQTVTTNSVTITVYGELMAGTTSADQTVCYGESSVLAATAPTGGSRASNFSYQWQSFNGTGWDDLIAPGSKTLSFNSGALTMTMKYRLMQTDNYCNPDKIVFTNTVTVTVLRDLIPGKITSDKTTVCYNESQLLTTTNPIGGSGTFDYQWQYFNGIDWAPVANGVTNAQTYNTGTLIRSTQYRLSITDTYCKTNTIRFTDPLTINVNGLLVAGKAGNDQSICYGETPAALTATSPTGGCGTFSYQWQSKVGTSDWVSITGATSLTYSPPALYVNTSYQLVQTDETCSPKQTVTTNGVTIAVYGELKAGTASVDQTICNGESTVLTATAPAGGSGSSNYSYQWQSFNGTGWDNLIAPGSTTLSFNTGALTMTMKYRLVQTDSYCNPDKIVYTNAVTVTVLRDLIPGRITSDKTTVCYNESQLLTTTNPIGGSGTFDYQWQYFNGIDWAPVANGVTNAQTYNTGTLIRSTQYRLSITDTYCKTNTTRFTDPLTITVNGLLVAGKVGNDQSICYGETPAALTTTNPTGGCGTYSYQWQSKVGTSDWASITGATSLTYSPPALYVNTSYQLVQTDESCSPKQSVTTNVVTITVFGEFKVGIASLNQTICYGESAVLTATAPTGGSGSSNYSYQWQSFNGTGWNDLNTAGATTLFFNTGALVATTQYRLVQSDIFCKSGQQLNTNTITIIVHEMPEAGTVTSSQSVCFGESPEPLTSTPPIGGSGNFKYQWQTMDASNQWTNIGGAASLIYIPPKLYVTTLYRLLQTDLGCTPAQPVVTNEVIITVYDKLLPGTAGTDQTVCYGKTVNLSSTPPTGGSTNISYRWQYFDGIQWQNADNQGSNWDALTYTTDKLYQNTQFRLLQSDINCITEQVVITNTVTVMINTPTVAAGDDGIQCGQEAYHLTGASATFAELYTWSTSGTGVFGDQFVPNAYYHPSAKDMNDGSVVLTLTIEDGCGNIFSDDMVLTLGQLPAVNFVNSTPNCSNKTMEFTDQSRVSNGYINKWVWDFGDGTTETVFLSDNRRSISHTFDGSAPRYKVTLTVYTSLGCSAVSERDIVMLEPPVARFSYKEILCDNQPLQFYNETQNNGAIGVQSLIWDFGDPTTGTNNTSNEQMPLHLFSKSGNFDIKLSVINSNNCSAFIVKTVNIKLPPSVDFSFNTTCLNVPVSFTVDQEKTDINSVVSWFWEFGDGVTSNNRDVLHPFTSPGTYNVKLTVTDVSGCSNSVVHQVVINPLPIAHFDSKVIDCTNSEVKFNERAFTTTGYVVRWIWSFGDGNSHTVDYPSNPNITHKYSNPGLYKVTLTVITSNDCTNSEVQSLTIYPIPVVNFSFITSCNNMPMEFSDLTQTNGGGDIVKWNWNFGDEGSGASNNSTIQNPNHLFSAPGSYNVTLTTTNTTGCQNSKTQTIQSDKKLIAGFTPTTNRCEGESVVFTDGSTTPDGTAIVSYSWDFGDTGTSKLRSPTHVYKSYGSFTAKLDVVNSNGCRATINQQITVSPKPVADFSFSDLRCIGNPVNFTDHSYVTAGFNNFITSWEWDFGDGTDPVIINYPNSPNLTHIFKPGLTTYNVRLTVTTTTSCSVFKEIVVTANDATFNGIYGPYCLSDLPVTLSATPAGGKFTGLGIQGNVFSPTNAGVGAHTITYTSPAGSCPVAPIVINVVSSPVVKTTPQFVPVCNGAADLTRPAVTAGSTPGLYFTYFKDEQAINPVDDPTAVPLGTYYIRGATMSGKCITVQSVTVSPSDPLKITLTSVSPECSGSSNGSITVKAVNGASPYSYRLNSDPVQTSPTFQNLKAGYYLVTVTDANTCTDTVSITLKDNPNAKIVISHKDILCANDANGSAKVVSINGIASSLLTGYKYSWSTTPVQTRSEATQLTKGLFTVTVTDTKGCGIKESVTIAVLDKEPPTIVCRKEPLSIVLQASVNDPLSNTNTLNEVAVELVKPVVSDNCGIASLTNDAPASFRVGVVTPVLWTVTDLVGLTDTCTSYVYVKMIPTIPKLVTPNGDGLNDLFIIDGLKDFPTSQLTIFTRSGELVYSSADYKNDWDCKFSGLKFSNNQFVSPGVYYYILNLGGTTQNIKGYVYVSY